ncbi:uncharacterized protein VTP21DRAFT_5183 [Calcarisporiella thermophila]|uniref:uncharacterized protein n=1 Tax=Calcarisporiella thermophila TaxID=911321 RepID=UPI0037428A26
MPLLRRSFSKHTVSSLHSSSSSQGSESSQSKKSQSSSFVDCEAEDDSGIGLADDEVLAVDDSEEDSDYSDDSDSVKSAKRPRLSTKKAVASNRTTRSGVALGRSPTIRAYNTPTLISKKNGQDSRAILTKKFVIPFQRNEKGEITHPRAASLVSTVTNRTLGVRRMLGFSTRAVHDHTAEDAIILYDPTLDEEVIKQQEEEQARNAAENASKGNVKSSRSLAEILGHKKQEITRVHVVVDPVLGRVLRPHQIEGVKFMYNCVTGKIIQNSFGCIMADEMGLGKTLQCITLLWSLLRQSPHPTKPTIEKAIITCPSSLVRNWANELVKWLGPSRISPLVIDKSGSKENLISSLKAFASAHGRMVVNPVLIVSYETLRGHINLLQNIPIGLLLCDEGHRLKNSDSQTFQALNSIQVQRRVILSGTPLQNDLTEYFTLLSFVAPGLLGTNFRRDFELPILRGRDALATDKERELGDQKLRELWETVSKIIIRRTNDLLTKYLPVKYEHVVFCRLSELQLMLYNFFITSPEIKKLLRGTGSQPLKAITMLKKLCNHPDLLNLPDELEGSEVLLPENYVKDKRRYMIAAYSGKMLVLERMLEKINEETNDKVVLISNYTQTLDLFEKLCRQRKYGCLRLDGSTTISKRQKLVDRFNDPNGTEFIFLLSSKAAGCGLNLVAANRLVLFDPDWNPGSDQQALARVWRDGQKKDCFIYRFIATGTIEEKIFQRQSHKQSLSTCVVDESADVERHFSQENLRQLFQFNENTECETHDTFRCKRCKDGRQIVRAANMQYGDASTWNHHGDAELQKLPDAILRAEAGQRTVSYVFQYKSHCHPQE